MDSRSSTVKEVHDASGRYVARPDGRPIRVFTRIDTRLMFEDLFAKLAQLPAR
jgi:purine nucleosidase